MLSNNFILKLFLAKQKFNESPHIFVTAVDYHVLSLVLCMSSSAKLREIQSLSFIMNKVLRTENHHSLSRHHKRLPSLEQLSKRSYGESSKEQSERYANKSPSKDLRTINRIPFFERKSHQGKLHRPKGQFCGKLFVKDSIRPILRKIVNKYKRNFHPSNASQNLSVCTEIRQSKSLKMEMGETVKNQLRHMSVLSKVIAQNNRKQARIQRQSSIRKQLSLL